MIIITLDGGLVQGVLTDDPELLKQDCVVVDYDAEGCDDAVKNMAGDDCCPSRHEIRIVASEYVDDIVKITAERDAM